MKKFRQYIEEAFDKPYPYTYKPGIATAKLDDGSKLEITMNRFGKMWIISFRRDEKTNVTGQGDQMRVFATVIDVIKKFIEKESPEKIFFSAEKNEDDKDSRQKLYSKLIKRFANKMGYNSKETVYKDAPEKLYSKLSRKFSKNSKQKSRSSTTTYILTKK